MKLKQLHEAKHHSLPDVDRSNPSITVTINEQGDPEVLFNDIQFDDYDEWVKIDPKQGLSLIQNALGDIERIQGRESRDNITQADYDEFLDDAYQSKAVGVYFRKEDYSASVMAPDEQ